jgi:hypothetical protein
MLHSDCLLPNYVTLLVYWFLRFIIFSKVNVATIYSRIWYILVKTLNPSLDIFNNIWSKLWNIVNLCINTRLFNWRWIEFLGNSLNHYNFVLKCKSVLVLWNDNNFLFIHCLVSLISLWHKKSHNVSESQSLFSADKRRRALVCYSLAAISYLKN